MNLITTVRVIIVKSDKGIFEVVVMHLRSKIHYEVQRKIWKKKEKEETKKQNKTGRSQLISWLVRQNHIKINDFCVLAMHAILQVLSKDIYLKLAFP